MQSYFKQLFEYDRWAMRRLMEKFEHQFPQNERIYVLMAHILLAQRVWLDRCLDLPQTIDSWSGRLPDEIRHDVENNYLAWDNLLGQLQPDDFNRAITYTNKQGDTYTNTVTDIIAHVLTHGTHHRGQIMTMMKEEGFVLPNIDYITYVR